jgi:hypothetical protein
MLAGKISQFNKKEIGGRRAYLLEKGLGLQERLNDFATAC